MPFSELVSRSTDTIISLTMLFLLLAWYVLIQFAIQFWFCVAIKQSTHGQKAGYTSITRNADAFWHAPLFFYMLYHLAYAGQNWRLAPHMPINRCQYCFGCWQGMFLYSLQYGFVFAYPLKQWSHDQKAGYTNLTRIADAFWHAPLFLYASAFIGIIGTDV